MLIAFDTATQTASIAIYDIATHKLLSEWTWQARRRQTQDLLVTADRMLQQIALTPKQISAIAVTTGPGSFTGVRIAISAAKGIGLGLPNTPIAVGLPTLSVTAAPFLETHRNQKVNVCTYLQAGRGRYNWAYVSADQLDSPLLWQPEVANHESGTADEFTESLSRYSQSSIDDNRDDWGGCIVVGEKTAELAEAMSGMQHVYLLDEVSSTRRAGQLARLAAAHIEAGSVTTLSALSPLYLRSP